MEETDIKVCHLAIGKVQLDPADARGEGGEHDPRLVIPIKIELHPQPLEHQVAIVRLSATLHLSEHPQDSNQFAAKMSTDTLYNMPFRSVPLGSSSTMTELRFSLTHAQLKDLETMRHEPGKNLFLRIDPVIVWIKHTGNNQGIVAGVPTLEESGWVIDAGMLSDFAFFWLPFIGTLRLNLARMDWVGKIYPGMGYDNFRLLEVKLPQAGNRLVPAGVVEHFKEAKDAYDRGMYRECLRNCRLVHEAVENELEGRLSYRFGRDHKLGEAVTQDLGWTPGSEQETFLNGMWKPLYVMANASTHTPSTKSLLPADAHIALILTAALLEYLAQLE